MNEQVGSTPPPYTDIKGRKPLMCRTGSTELPESARVEWGCVLGNTVVHEEPASPFSGIDVIGMVSRLYLELKCLSNYIKGARMFNMCFSTDDGKLTLDTVMTDIIERVDRISKDTESILTGGQKPNENTTRNVP